MNIYVHIDLKSNEIFEEDIKELNYKNIKVIRKYDIQWGTFNHILAILDLMKLEIKDNNTYFHIISGQDYKIKSLNYFKEHFNGNNLIYMSVTDEKHMSEEVKNRYKVGIYNSFCSLKDNEVREKNKSFSRNCDNIGEFKKIYKGVIWSSIPNYAVKYILDYVSANEEFLNDLMNCIIPKEFFLQTILMNSKYKSKVVEDNLRYILWELKNGSNPAFLDETDFKNIQSDETAIFARKTDSIISQKLINLIDEGSD